MLWNTLRKAAHLTTTAVDASKEDVYTKIYPGCVVSNLSISATAGQEIECSVDMMPKTTFVAPQTTNPEMVKLILPSSLTLVLVVGAFKQEAQNMPPM